MGGMSASQSLWDLVARGRGDMRNMVGNLV
jgi:hypothetical protein